jgi:hypothetical protein
MTESTILWYDHAGSLAKQLIEVKRGNVKRTFVLGDLAKVKLGIGHPKNNSEWMRMVKVKSPADSVRIRTSSAGRLGSGHKIAAGVVELNLIPPHAEVSPKAWETIIDKIVQPGVAQNIVSGIIPLELEPFFCGPKSLETLIALSILCQGYLIVHANKRSAKTPENLKNWALDGGKDYSDRVKQVQGHEFWDIFDEMRGPGLQQKAKSEFDALPGGGKFENIESLINEINKRQVITNIGIVLRAYEVIAAKLGTQRAD